MTTVLRTKNKKTVTGFCNTCGYVRNDVDGYPVSDCLCTAKMKHATNCQYVKAISMMVSVGECEKHGYDACEECHCDCIATGHGIVVEW